MSKKKKDEKKNKPVLEPNAEAQIGQSLSGEAEALSALDAVVTIKHADGSEERVQGELLETTAEPFEMPLEFIDEKIEPPELLNPGDLAVDKAGNLYCARGHKIIKIDIFGGTAVIAGADKAGYSGDGGPAENALLNAPCSIAISGDRIFILDSGNAAIRVIHQGIISTHATL